jgi:hypothetical protein
MKYVLLLFGTTQDAQRWEEMTEEARAQQYAQAGRWFGEHSAKIRGSHQLQPPHTATSVRFASGGEPIVSDGPFLEGNEVIGGYIEIEVADLDEALQMAKTWPGRGTVEIRPVIEQR